MLPPIYPPEAVQPFRDELNVVGLKDLLTPEEVDNNAQRYQKIYQDIFR